MIGDIRVYDTWFGIKMLEVLDIFPPDNQKTMDVIKVNMNGNEGQYGTRERK